MAEPSTLLSRFQAELRQAALDLRACEPAEELLCCLKVFRFVQGHAALANGRVFAGELDEAARFAKVRAGGDGEGDEGRLRIAGIGELGRLQDVLAPDQLGREDLLELQGAEFGRGRLAVGGVQVIRNSDAGHFGTGEGAQAQRLGRGVLSRPENEDAGGVQNGLRVGGEVGVGELLRVGAVGGEKEVCRRAVLDLLREGGGGAEGGCDADAGLAFELIGQRGQNGLKVCSGDDVQFTRRLGPGRRMQQRECKEVPAEAEAEGLTVG